MAIPTKKKHNPDDDKFNEFLGCSKDAHINENINDNINLNINLNNKILVVEKPIKFYDTHKNEAFLVRKDIVLELNKLCKKGGKGFKTRFINEAIKEHLLRYGIETIEIKQ